mmetsp:Transcript_15801/g.39770  ORF Transcript_15801/g.39770 Transcript_15801/m.39770 type:complete len:231 (-) Transcript_15801:752-1444(-)
MVRYGAHHSRRCRKHLLPVSIRVVEFGVSLHQSVREHVDLGEDVAVVDLVTKRVGLVQVKGEFPIRHLSNDWLFPPFLILLPNKRVHRVTPDVILETSVQVCADTRQVPPRKLLPPRRFKKWLEIDGDGRGSDVSPTVGYTPKPAKARVLVRHLADTVTAHRVVKHSVQNILPQPGVNVTLALEDQCAPLLPPLHCEDESVEEGNLDRKSARRGLLQEESKYVHGEKDQQ